MEELYIFIMKLGALYITFGAAAFVTTWIIGLKELKGIVPSNFEKLFLESDTIDNLKSNRVLGSIFSMLEGNAFMTVSVMIWSWPCAIVAIRNAVKGMQRDFTETEIKVHW